MKVTFVFHSCFVVELEKHILIFDYYGEGRLPEFPKGKKICFLNSHGHQDHFRRETLSLREQYPDAEYILSRDIRFRNAERSVWVHSVKPREQYEIGGLHVETLRSTDLGVAFVVETAEKRIYHAGDLNWWHWDGEDKAWNNNMAANYKHEIDRLAGRHFDAAFVPLDPRLGQAYSWGMKYFLEKTDTAAVWPMHLWEKYETCKKLREEPKMQGLLSAYQPVEYPGQEWNLC